ncbi:MAG TPA: protein kinase [Candidatus Limnocylindrales bacterium]|nr:protein kinase [Candidatus Limnocylindrales bacterium]
MQAAPRKGLDDVEEIFAGAVELRPQDREAFLDAACARNPLARQEVESLLAFDDESGLHISGVLARTAASLVEEPSMVGRRFGPYLAESLVGAGGMGLVYGGVRADDEFQKRVAIKVVKRGMDTAAVLERFRDERQILASLDHPYIAKLLDGGTTEEGVPYFVMEFIEGKPIDEYCESRGLGVRERCELLRRVCAAVSFAHKNLVIHRDLKPNNVLVTSDGTPRLLDFGIAKLLRSEPVESTATRIGGSMALTPDYASPEQVCGGAITMATDVYALGAVLYKVLTGVKPHGLTGHTRAEVEDAVCHREPLRPSLAAPENLRRVLSGDLDNIAMMALRKDAGRRYQYVEQLSEDLRRYLSGLPVSAREDTVWYRAVKFLQRHRVGVAACSLTLAGLLAGGVAAAWEARQANQARKLAEARLEAIAELANTVLFDVHDRLERLPGATETRKQLVGSTLTYLDRLANTTGADPNILGALHDAYMRMGDVQGLPAHPNLGNLSGAEASYRKAAALLDRDIALHPGRTPLLARKAEVHRNIGLIVKDTGRPAEAAQHFQISLDAAAAAIKRDAGNKAARTQAALTNLEMADLKRDAPDEALVYARRGADIAEQLAAQYPQEADAVERVSDTYSEIGQILHRANRLNEALESFKKAAAIRADLIARHPYDALLQRELMMAYGHISDVLGTPFGSNLGRHEEAFAYLEKAGAIATEMAKADPSNHLAASDLATVLMREGLVLEDAKDARRSLELLRRAAAMKEEMQLASPTNRRNRSDLGLIYEYEGARLAQLGENQAALDQLKKAADITHTLLAGGDTGSYFGNLSVRRRIALVKAVQHDWGGAVQDAEETIADADRWAAERKDIPRLQQYRALSRFWMAEVYEKFSAWRAAAGMYEASLERWRDLAAGQRPGNADTEVVRTEKALGRVRELMKRSRAR